MARKSGSVSSSSSVSPASTNVSLPYTSSSFQHPLDIKPQHYHLEQYPNSWSSSSSVTTDEISSYRSSPMAFDYSPDNTTPSTPSPNSDYQSYDLPMNHQVSPYSESTQLYQESVPPVTQPNQVYKPFHNHGHADTPFQGHQFSHFPAVQVHSGNDSADQFGIFEGQATSVDATSAITGLSWDAMSSTQDVKPLSGGFRAPLANNTYSVSS
ncbi:hypothetical protein CPB83DRAFT_419793 [Crepidotus variabilis]|uniref:Uncharacterized protein n=1 Tax=Crepidotus variabilis TaxID=179855 RepID=A0A9P6ESE5_9AGAR|nr:hypothetical protein CPB83DRAFT_419793 [Crepidotus variabilis]